MLFSKVAVAALFGLAAASPAKRALPAPVTTAITVIEGTLTTITTTANNLATTIGGPLIISTATDALAAEWAALNTAIVAAGTLASGDVATLVSQVTTIASDTVTAANAVVSQATALTNAAVGPAIDIAAGLGKTSADITFATLGTIVDTTQATTLATAKTAVDGAFNLLQSTF